MKYRRPIHKFNFTNKFQILTNFKVRSINFNHTKYLFYLINYSLQLNLHNLDTYSHICITTFNISFKPSAVSTEQFFSGSSLASLAVFLLGQLCLCEANGFRPLAQPRQVFHQQRPQRDAQGFPQVKKLGLLVWTGIRFERNGIWLWYDWDMVYLLAQNTSPETLEVLLRRRCCVGCNTEAAGVGNMEVIDRLKRLLLIYCIFITYDWYLATPS